MLTGADHSSTFATFSSDLSGCLIVARLIDPKATKTVEAHEAAGTRV